MLKEIKEAIKTFKKEIEKSKNEKINTVVELKTLRENLRENFIEISELKNRLYYLNGKLNDEKKLTVKKIICLLKYYDFQLVGSRNLKLSHSDSDYDFMTSDKEKFESFMKDLNDNYFVSNEIIANDGISFAHYEQYPHLYRDDESIFHSKQEFKVENINNNSGIMIMALRDIFD